MSTVEYRLFLKRNYIYSKIGIRRYSQIKGGGKKRGGHSRQKSFLEAHKIFNDCAVIFTQPSIGKNIQ